MRKFNIGDTVLIYNSSLGIIRTKIIDIHELTEGDFYEIEDSCYERNYHPEDKLFSNFNELKISERKRMENAFTDFEDYLKEKGE